MMFSSSTRAVKRAPRIGGVTTIRFLVRGGAGMVIDGAMRDVPSSRRCIFRLTCAAGTHHRWPDYDDR